MRAARWLPAAAAGLLVYAVALALRLRDPLSTPMLGAEDPFSHVVIVREATANGYFAGPRSLDGPLYPPGLHALVSPLWSLSGLDLVTLSRLGPPALGALGAVGIAALLWREAGPWGALAGGLVAATAPEAIFRSDLLFPTTLDSALVPLFLLALARAAEGERAAAALLALVGAAVMVAHPWALMLLAPIGVAYPLLRALLPPHGAPRRLAGAGIACALSAALGLVTFLWWRDAAFIGLGTFSRQAGNALPIAARTLGVPLAALVASAAALAAVVTAAALAPARWRSRVGAAAGAALVAAALALVLRLGDRPAPDVDDLHMLGAPAIVLALTGLALAPARRTRAGDLGLVVVALTYPFTAVNVFQSAYWPSRTVAYMIPGVALLAGHAIGTLAAVRLPAVPRPRLARPALGAAAVALVAIASVPVGAAGYTWYRYEPPAGYQVVQRAAALADADRGVVIVCGSWEPNLFARALVKDPLGSVAWSPQAFEDAGARDALLAREAASGRHVYFLLDDSTRAQLGLAPGGSPPGRVVEEADDVTLVDAGSGT